jgi:outer membrane lipoprotein-sorting protein
MTRLRAFTFAVGILALSAYFVQAQGEVDLKAILRKSIEAHGGEKNLAKFKAAMSKYKGTLELMNNKIEVTGETSFQKPDKLRNTIELNIANMKINVISVYNGKTLWVSTQGTTMEIDDEKILNDTKESLQIEGAGSFADFLKAPYELNSLGEIKVKGKEAIGIRVSKKGQKDFNLYLDKKTHLIVKTEMRSYDPMTKQEVNQEKFIIGYQDKNGMKVGKRVEIYKDDKLFMDIEITDVQMAEKLDDSIFAKP